MKKVIVLVALLGSITLVSKASTLPVHHNKAEGMSGNTNETGYTFEIPLLESIQEEIQCSGVVEVCAGHYHVFCYYTMEDLDFEVEECYENDCG